MLTQHIGLVPEVEGMDFAELARVSAALQKQLARDVAPAWGVLATVDAFPSLDELPIGYWPVILSSGALGRQAGVHLDDNGQPYAQVQIAERWSLAASRACVELVVNPYGARTVSGQSLRTDQGPVEFVLEPCGPCEDARHAYAINGVLVADFCLPAFFEPAASASRLTSGGAAALALRPLPGGHVCWYEPVAGSYWLRSHWSDNPIDTRLGSASAASVREMLNACTALRVPDEPRSLAALEASARSAQRAAKVRAHRLRALLGRRLEADLGTALALEHDDLERDDLERDENEPDYATVAVAELVEVAPAPTVSSEALRSKAATTASTPPARRPASIPPSLAPIALPSVGAAPAPAGKRPWLALLAGAAAIGLFWLGIAARNDHAPARSAAHARTAVAAPAPTPAAVPPAAPAPPIVLPPAPPASPPTQPTQAQPIAPAQAASPLDTRPREPSARRRAEQSAGALPPAPPAPAPATSTAKATPAKIEDLIETRR